MERKGWNSDKERQGGTARHQWVGGSLAVGDLGKARMGAGSGGLMLLSGGKGCKDNLDRRFARQWYIGGGRS